MTAEMAQLDASGVLYVVLHLMHFDLGLNEYMAR